MTFGTGDRIRNEPPHPYGHRLSLLLAWGDRHQAAHLLESLS